MHASTMDPLLRRAWNDLLGGLPLRSDTLASDSSLQPRLTALHAGVSTRSSDVVAATAVSLAFLRAFHEPVVKPLSAGEPPWATKAVVERLIKPLATGCNSLADLLPPAAVGAPTAFISHAWGTCHFAAAQPECGCAPGAGTFALLVESALDFFANAVAEEVFVWLDIFAINQHDASGAELYGGLTLEKTIKEAAHTLVILDRVNALPLSRLWCSNTGAKAVQQFLAQPSSRGARRLRRRHDERPGRHPHAEHGRRLACDALLRRRVV